MNKKTELRFHLIVFKTKALNQDSKKMLFMYVTNLQFVNLASTNLATTVSSNLFKEHATISAVTHQKPYEPDLKPGSKIAYFLPNCELLEIGFHWGKLRSA